MDAMIEGAVAQGPPVAEPADKDAPPHAARDRDPDELARFRRSMRRLAATYASLPVSTSATCPTCRQVVAAVFDRLGDQVVLTYDCGRCGPRSEAHHDRIWTPADSDVPGSATRTYSGTRIRPVIRRLPRTVETLCPECGAIVLGRYFVEDHAVFIEKTCPDHGYFRDCISSDVLLFSKAAWWSYQDYPGQKHPRAEAGQCPSNCGLCGQHISGSVLAQIDLTSRCNMRCPICFANAGTGGSFYQGDYAEVMRQLRVLRDFDPVPCTAVQFTGGEPTIHPDFLRIVAAARDMGFSHIQIATNGLKLADEAFARQAAAAGLHTLYLQFDGVSEDAYRQTRNFPGIWKKKLEVIENCRRTGMKICLVPTIVKGVNDDQVGRIFRFAVENVDVVSAISYQPVSFSGRITTEELARRRYTLGDLAHDVAGASGASLLRDMFPLSIVAPLAEFLEAFSAKPKVCPSCHPDCAFGTYFLISPDGRAYPFPRVINVEGMFTEMHRLATRIRRRGRPGALDKWRALRMFKRHFNGEAAPPGLTVKRFVKSLYGLVDKNVGRGKGEKNTYKTLLCAGMHFQDRYNYDVERTKRCVILYSTPAGVMPFCAYNCGPEYRAVVERAYGTRVAGPDNQAADRAGQAAPCDHDHEPQKTSP